MFRSPFRVPVISHEEFGRLGLEPSDVRTLPDTSLEKFKTAISPKW